MKRIDTSLVNTNTGMRFKSGMLDLLQDNNAELLSQLMYSLFGGRSVVGDGAANVLWGCKNSSTDPDFLIGEGAIAFYNGFTSYTEIFQLIPSAFTAAIGAVVIQVNQDVVGAASDPVAFSDGSSHNVMFNRQFKVVDGDASTPGYICDYSALNFNISQQKWTTYNVPNGKVTVTGGGGFSSNSCKFRYKIAADGTIQFQFLIDLILSGTVTAITLNLDDIFTNLSGSFIGGACWSSVQNESLSYTINNTTSLLRVQRATSFSTGSQIIFANGVGNFNP